MFNIYFQLLDILKEVHHLRSNEEYKDLLPLEGLAIFEKQETYRQYRINLGITIDWYNQIRKNSQKVEFDLVEDEIKAIDQRIEMAQNKLNWNSDGEFFYFENDLGVTENQSYVITTSLFNFRPMELFTRAS